MFNTHRGVYQGREVSDNVLKGVLSKEKDSRKRREAWEAQKSVASAVAPLLVQLVKLRNKAARGMGYKNYYEMSLRFDEQDPDEVFRIFDDLAARTDEPFRALKADIDRQLAARWGIRPDDMQPWHYPGLLLPGTPGSRSRRSRRHLRPPRRAQAGGRVLRQHQPGRRAHPREVGSLRASRQVPARPVRRHGPRG